LPVPVILLEKMRSVTRAMVVIRKILL